MLPVNDFAQTIHMAVYYFWKNQPKYCVRLHLPILKMMVSCLHLVKFREQGSKMLRVEEGNLTCVCLEMLVE